MIRGAGYPVFGSSPEDYAAGRNLGAADQRFRFRAPDSPRLQPGVRSKVHAIKQWDSSAVADESHCKGWVDSTSVPPAEAGGYLERSGNARVLRPRPAIR